MVQSYHHHSLLPFFLVGFVSFTSLIILYKTMSLQIHILSCLRYFIQGIFSSPFSSSLNLLPLNTSYEELFWSFVHAKTISNVISLFSLLPELPVKSPRFTQPLLYLILLLYASIIACPSLQLVLVFQLPNSRLHPTLLYYKNGPLIGMQ